jgi:hypothetical protein
MGSRMPFAVVGSNTVIQEQGGKRVRGRKYPRGTVVIENKDHCDFLPLRDLLLAHHMQDLKDVTNYVHYENFRCRRLTEMFAKDGRNGIPDKNPLAALEDESKEHIRRVDKTMEDMEQVFEKKVVQKENMLLESGKNMKEIIRETKEKLEEQKQDLERQREEFLKERKVWENNNFVASKNLRRKQSLESLLSGTKKKYGLGMMTFKGLFSSQVLRGNKIVIFPNLSLFEKFFPLPLQILLLFLKFFFGLSYYLFHIFSTFQ